MSKTPISLLQELMVQRKGCLPDYCIENCSDIPGAAFKCTVRVGNVKAIAYASSKQEAKQNSAKKALELLGSSISSSTILPQKEITLLVNCSTKQAPFINYVGKLNELASTNAKPYPVYHDEFMPNVNGIFATVCSFLDFTSEGYGLKKKDAKQDAARNMLEQLKDKDISIISIAIGNMQLEKSKNLESLTREVLKSYGQLEATTTDINPLKTTFLSIPNLKKTVSSLEDLTKALEKYGYKYTVETFQRDPYIMMMKICDTSAVMMGRGDTKQKALSDLYENVVLMLDNGFSLKTSF